MGLSLSESETAESHLGQAHAFLTPASMALVVLMVLVYTITVLVVVQEHSILHVYGPRQLTSTLGSFPPWQASAVVGLIVIIVEIGNRIMPRKDSAEESLGVSAWYLVLRTIFWFDPFVNFSNDSSKYETGKETSVWDPSPSPSVIAFMVTLPLFWTLVVPLARASRLNTPQLLIWLVVFIATASFGLLWLMMTQMLFLQQREQRRRGHYQAIPLQVNDDAASLSIPTFEELHHQLKQSIATGQSIMTVMNPVEEDTN